MNPGTLRRKIKQSMTKRKKSISKLIRELDSVVSKYVRTLHADSTGAVYCYTCNHPGTIKTLQCGHYVSRYYKGTRWELDNLRPQCVMCNLWKRGDAPTFRSNLVGELGEERVKEMEMLRFKVFKKEPSWYEEQILHYQKLLEEL